MRVGPGLIVLLILILGVAIIGFASMDITTVGGNELGVKETWSGGVDPTVYQPKTYFLTPGWSQDMYTYDMSPKVLQMPFKVRCSDNQTLTMTLRYQWRYDPKQIINVHKTYKTHSGVRGGDEIIEKRLINQVLISAVNTEATRKTAISAYSGEGFVELQEAIKSRLTQDAELTQYIITDNFAISEPTFEDHDYIGEINKRQVAQQRELRAKQEELAAIAEANRAKAEAQSDLNRRVVEAERDKQVQVLASEAAAAQQVNAATAAASQVTIAATAEKEAADLKAQAITALGAAEAEATKLRLTAYSAPGSENFVRVEVAKQVAVAYGGIRGYLPEGMTTNLFTGNFMDSVRSLMGEPAR